jgi:hypothetical protein
LSLGRALSRALILASTGAGNLSVALVDGASCTIGGSGVGRVGGPRSVNCESTIHQAIGGGGVTVCLTSRGALICASNLFISGSGSGTACLSVGATDLESSVESIGCEMLEAEHPIIIVGRQGLPAACPSKLAVDASAAAQAS